MPTMAEINQLWTAQDTIKADAERTLRRLLSRVDPSNPFEFLNVLLEAMPELVARYGELAGALAAEWVEAVSGIPGIIPDTLDLAAVEGSARWAASSTLTGQATMAVATDHAIASAQRHILQSGRDTVIQSSANVTTSWARVLRGPKNCAFCVTMAARGAVYTSEKAASHVVGRGKTADEVKLKRHKALAKGVKSRGKRDVGAKFHDKCDCAVVAIRDESDWPEGYDLESLEGMYDSALEQSTGSLKASDTKAIKERLAKYGKEPDGELLSVLQVMRKQQKIH